MSTCACLARRFRTAGVCYAVSMKRALIFSLAYFPKHVGGAEVAIKEITDRIDPSEIEFHLVCLRFDSTLPLVEKIGNVTVHRIGFARENPSMADLRVFPLKLNKYLFQFWAAWQAMRLHRRYQFDAIWAMMAHSCGVPAAIMKFFHPDVKYVLTLQEGDPPEYIERLAKPVWPLFVRAFTTADTIQCISHFLAAWAKRMGFAGVPIVVPNAVDVKHFANVFSDAELNDLRMKLGKREGERYVITTSRLVPKNAVDVVIRAMKHLPADVTFLVLGIGPDEAELKALAAYEGVADRVRFLGQVGHAELPKYLRVADVFTRPSRSEGMGNSFVEAMAAGIPVVATQAGGIVDFLFDPEVNPEKPSTGLFAKIGDPEDTARQLKRFLDDAVLRDTCTKNAKTLVTAEYDWDLIATKMRDHVFRPLWKTL